MGCKQCTNLRLAWGFAKDDLRDAARKCSRNQTPALIERIKDAKAAVAEATRLLNEHKAGHEGEAA